jgi:uncharacterized protein YbjQ (UPF0145 family)
VKSKDIIKQHFLNASQFDEWLVASGYAFTRGRMGGLEVSDDQNIEEIVAAFRAHLAEQHEQAMARAREEDQAAEEKQTAMAKMLITSGFSFDGFTITKYSGYISGDDAIQVDRGRQGWLSNVTDVGATLMKSLVEIRRNALAELKEAAYLLGCNAVIGVDFDYLTLDPETVNASGGTLYLPYVFGVTANGNAVIIEKNS